MVISHSYVSLPQGKVACSIQPPSKVDPQNLNRGMPQVSRQCLPRRLHVFNRFIQPIFLGTHQSHADLERINRQDNQYIRVYTHTHIYIYIQYIYIYTIYIYIYIQYIYIYTINIYIYIINIFIDDYNL